MSPGGRFGPVVNCEAKFKDYNIHTHTQTGLSRYCCLVQTKGPDLGFSTLFGQYGRCESTWTVDVELCFT